MDITNGHNKILSPEETILQNFENVICKNCNWSFHRPTLIGVCPNCSGELYFSQTGSMGKVVEFPQIERKIV